jgi:DNA-binding SARP family transcriptional activator
MRRAGTGEWPLAATALPYSFRLFGRFQARRADAEWELEGRKIQEVISYLLVFRERAHQREVLAGTLWDSSTTAQSRRYLRQAIWQLNKPGFLQTGDPKAPLLLLEPEWVQVNTDCVWLDVDQLEASFDRTPKIPGERMTEADAHVLKNAVTLYRGDLLDGWYQDWCIYERERLKVMYLTMVEKLLGYCEARGKPEEGLLFGERLLRHDRAHERAHWRLMRLYYLAGDRTGALRQFQRCRTALDEELGVGPGERITTLYEQIRTDQGVDLSSVTVED